MLKNIMSALVALMLFAAPSAMAQSASAPDLSRNADDDLKDKDFENMLYLDLIYGRVVIELYPDVAPNHVERIKRLTRKKFYDRLYFHRVIQGFMAQTGDPNGDGTGGSDLPDLKAEFSEEIGFEKGTLGMARSESPDSANSQFFIVFTDDGASHLDGKYTIFGKVIQGQRYVNRIMKGDGPNGSFSDPLDQDRILRLRVAADVIAENEAKKAEAEAKKAAEEATATDE